MATTLVQTGVKFPDNSIQTTAVLGGSTDVQLFTTSGTWNKPATGSMCAVLLIGGGGGGGACSDGWIYGGYGGAIVSAIFKLSDLASSVAVTIGSGGSGTTSVSAAGGNGGHSKFGSHLLGSGGSGAMSAGAGIVYPPTILETSTLIDTKPFSITGGSSKYVGGSGGFTANKLLGSGGSAQSGHGGSSPARGGAGGTDSISHGGEHQNNFGTGGTGAYNGSGGNATGYGAGGGSGRYAGGNGSPGYCKIIVW